MKIKFHWNKNLVCDTEKELEANMKEWLASGGSKQCHPGIVHIFFESTDPLNHTIKGRISCEKGDPFASFVSSPDGGTITPVQ